MTGSRAASLRSLPRSAHGVVTRDIAMRVLSGEYPEGSTLPPEADLMKRFAVSRTALREALKTLAAKGLLISKTKVGTRILEKMQWNMFDPQVLSWRIEMGVDRALLARLFEIRQALEPTAAALAAVRHTQQHLRQMAVLLGRMDRPGHDRDSYADADIGFHRAILAASGNPFMQTIGSVIEAAIQASFSVSSPVDEPSRFALSIERHRRVLHEIEQRSPQAASDAMSEVLREGLYNAHCEMAEVPLAVLSPLQLAI